LILLKILLGNLRGKINLNNSGGNILTITMIFLLLITTFYTINVGAQAKDSTVQIRAGFLKNKEDKVELSKGVEIKKDEIELSAPKGTLKREEKKLILTEGVKMNYDQGKIESQKMTGWLNDDRYLFEKDVIFDYKPQEKGKKGFVLRAPYLEMWSEEKSFIAKKGVTIDYDQKILKAEKAEYIDEKDQLILRENVYIKEENGDWVKSNKAVFDLGTEQESFTADGDVEIKIMLEQENNAKNKEE
jgi:lipopolysaccharide assembly outer membrane protein LptD (OstA)